MVDKNKIYQKIPYIAAIVVSVALILTYIASRTVGVPIVGVELLCWKTRYDLKNYANCGDCTVLCWDCKDSTSLYILYEHR